MNLRYLRFNIGKWFPFDRVPISFTWAPAGEFIPIEFNLWRLDGWDTRRQVLIFYHTLGYCPEISFWDFVGHEVGEVLKLRGQLIIHGSEMLRMARSRLETKKSSYK